MFNPQNQKVGSAFQTSDVIDPKVGSSILFDLFLFCRPLQLPQPLNINKTTKGGKPDRVGVRGKNRLSGWYHM